MIVDAHVHVGEWEHPDFLGRRSTLQGTVDVLTAAGVSGAAICPTDRCANAALAHAGGDTAPLATNAAKLVAEQCVDNVWFEFSGL